ncbi:hypothetical protein LIER_24723 [Lithospermum erythrorhizon]|uniref:AP2/ERF domain-containing protein n=1 Tax=Lithospermum erythrorhizon TaxID=34254 RepID=A0AAV3R2A9_LITER
MLLPNQSMRSGKKKSIHKNLQENKSKNIDEQVDIYVDDGVSTTSRKMVGVTKRNSGKYFVSIHDRIRKKDLCLGTYESPEEASKVYWEKKKELEKEFEALAKNEVLVNNNKRTSEYVGVSKRDSGKFAAHIRDPIRKKKLYLGAFDSEQEASKVYLAKKEELEKEAMGNKSVRWCWKRECRKPTSLQIRKRRNFDDYGNLKSSMDIDDLDSHNGDNASIDHVEIAENSSENNDHLCSGYNEACSKRFDDKSHSLNEESVTCKVTGTNLPMLEENNDGPCSFNQECSIDEIDHYYLDFCHEGIVSMEARVSKQDLLIEGNGEEKELIVIDADAKILLRTNSGTPVMDCNGFLLGEYSCIDDLSLSF